MAFPNKKQQFKKGQSGNPNGRPKGGYWRGLKTKVLESLKRDNQHYVYKHFIEKELIYIGHGTGLRAFDLNDKARNKIYQNKIKGRKKDITIKLIAFSLSKYEAFMLEKTLIKIHQPECNIQIYQGDLF